MSGREDVTQTVLGLSARWIWHLEEQRPLTLRCGRAAVYSPRTFVHTYKRARARARECKSVRANARVTAIRSLAHSRRQVDRDTPARRGIHTRRGWIAHNYPLSDTEIYVRIPRAHVTNGRSALKEKDRRRERKEERAREKERERERSTKSKGLPQHAP